MAADEAPWIRDEMSFIQVHLPLIQLTWMNENIHRRPQVLKSDNSIIFYDLSLILYVDSLSVDKSHLTYPAGFPPPPVPQCNPKRKQVLSLIY